VGTPLPPIKTPAQWAIQIKRLNILARVRAEKEAALAAGGQEAVPGASASSAEEVVIPTEHILVIAKNADITLPSSGSSDTNPVLNAPGFTILLKGEDGGTPVLKLGSFGGPLLDIWANQTIILENLKLEGVYPNNAPLVKVTGSSLELKDGTEVTGNENNGGTATAGGGIFLDGGSLLAGQGTKITGNTASGTNGKGGGIYALNGSSITLEDGTEISGNIASLEGGGIYFDGGVLDIIAGVKISGNGANGTNGKGGGIYAKNVDLTLEGGVIGGTSQSEGNTATIQGGGIYLSGGSLTLEDGAALSWNTTTASGDLNYGGGGIYADGTAVIMNGSSAVSNNSVNTSFPLGGSIYLINNGSLTMNDESVISDNNGIGVYLRNGGSLFMNGSSAISRNSGRGVNCYGSVKCTVTMNGNSVIGGFQQSDGNINGGVNLSGGPHILLMKDNAAIASNNVINKTSGGGVNVGSNGGNTATVTMEGNAVIRDNTSNGSTGGGMGIYGRATITLSGYAKIVGNKCTGADLIDLGGGGIYFSDTSSTLRIRDSAEISWNYSRARAGGVYKGPQSSQMINFNFPEGAGRVFSNTSGNGYPQIFP
jgi:hypothetical protein